MVREVVVGALLGVLLFGGFGGVSVLLGLALGALAGWVLRLSRRLAALEQEIQALKSTAVPVDVHAPPPTRPLAVKPAATPAPQTAALFPSRDPVGPRPPLAAAPPDSAPLPDTVPLPDSAPASGTPKPAPARSDPWTQPARTPAEPSAVEATFNRLIERAVQFFTTGNPVVRIGIVVLFFGVAFLLKYAAEAGLFPIELRLAAVAAGGIALLVTGWRLRAREGAYGLVLQGGGIGVLYLTLFAAAKIYSALPLALALVLMIGLVALCGLLAVRQDGRALAVAGAIGGFLAPVLMARGGGSHVLLFSYYGLLNIGIVGIAWHKAWRELNWLGFVFTFVIGSLWGARAYRPEHFASTEPFLVAFFGFYLAIAVLFAWRQPPKLRGLVDGTLVFGTPLVCFGLQSRLLADSQYGLAISAALLSALYLGLNRWLARRARPELETLSQAFLGLALLFGTLAIPLAFSARVSSALWAIEGAALIWLGLRQQQTLTRVFGALLPFAAGLMLLLHLLKDSPLREQLWLNPVFFGAALITLGALLGSLLLDKARPRLNGFERALGDGLLCWGWLWWFAMGLRDIDALYSGRTATELALAFIAVSLSVSAALCIRCQWSRSEKLPLALLPVAVLLGCILHGQSPTEPLLAGFSLLLWGTVLALQGLLLRLFAARWPAETVKVWHATGFWLAMALVQRDWALTLDQQLSHSPWQLALWPLPLAAALVLLEWRGLRRRWPLAAYPAIYGLIAPLPLATLSLLWFFGASASGPGPAHLPLFNPLDLAQLLVLCGLWRWQARVAARADALAHARPALTAVLRFGGFMWLNTVLARAIAHATTEPYTVEALWALTVFQLGLSLLWSITALLIMLLARLRASRGLWKLGAGLLVLVVAKLFLRDLADSGTMTRIVSFMAVGGLMLLIGYLSPLPPKAQTPR